MLFLVSLAAQAASPQALDLAESRSLMLALPAGNVTIEHGEAMAVSVTQTQWDDRCSLVVDDGTAASVSVKARRKADCAVDVVVTLPADGRVRLELAAGDVLVRQAQGSVDLLVEDGDVALDGATGSVFAAIDNGYLHGSTSGGLLAEMGVGDVSVAWSALPSGDIQVQARKGDVQLTLPAGVVLDDEARRDKDIFRVSLPGDRVLNATAQRGDIAVTSG